MAEFFKKIVDWLINILLSIYNSPAARKMAINALNVASNAGADMLEHVAQRVKEANGLDLTSEQKYDYVVRNTVDTFKDVSTNTLKQIIEGSVSIIKEELGEK
jgi:ABC-type metal ion transport system substrate-binding protein